MAYRGVGIDSSSLVEVHHSLMLVSIFGGVVVYAGAVGGDETVCRLE